MSIASNISTAVFSDCNTFATPTDSSCTKVVSFNIRIWANSARFYYRICFTGLLSDVLHCTCSAKIIFCPSHSQELFRFFLPVPTVLEVKTVANSLQILKIPNRCRNHSLKFRNRLNISGEWTMIFFLPGIA